MARLAGPIPAKTTRAAGQTGDRTCRAMARSASRRRRCEWQPCLAITSSRSSCLQSEVPASGSWTPDCYGSQREVIGREVRRRKASRQFGNSGGAGIGRRTMGTKRLPQCGQVSEAYSTTRTRAFGSPISMSLASTLLASPLAPFWHPASAKAPAPIIKPRRVANIPILRETAFARNGKASF